MRVTRRSGSRPWSASGARRPANRRTERPRHATELAREHADAEAVYVFSGDGGFNEVLNGIDGDDAGRVHSRRRSQRAPAALGLPARSRPRRGALATGAPRRISLGRVNGRRFGFAAGIGLDAEAIRRIEARGRTEDGARAGNLVFAWELARLLAEHAGRFEPALEILGRGRAAFALVANGDPYTYAGPVPLRVAPEARFELGIDLVAPRAVSPCALPRLLAYALLGGAGRARATSSTGTTSTGSRCLRRADADPGRRRGPRRRDVSCLRGGASGRNVLV